MNRPRIVSRCAALSLFSLAIFGAGCAAEELPPGRDPAEDGAVMGPHANSKPHGKRGDMTDLEIIAKDKARIRSEADGPVQLPAANHMQANKGSACGGDPYAPGGAGWLDCSTGRAVATDDAALQSWLSGQQNAPPQGAAPPTVAAPSVAPPPTE